MATRLVKVSDVSGDEIADGDLVVVKIDDYPDRGEVTHVEMARHEVQNVFDGKGAVKTRRGRPRKR